MPRGPPCSGARPHGRALRPRTERSPAWSRQAGIPEIPDGSRGPGPSRTGSRSARSPFAFARASRSRVRVPRVRVSRLAFAFARSRSRLAFARSRSRLAFARSRSPVRAPTKPPRSNRGGRNRCDETVPRSPGRIATGASGSETVATKPCAPDRPSAPGWPGRAGVETVAGPPAPGRADPSQGPGGQGARGETVTGPCGPGAGGQGRRDPMAGGSKPLPARGPVETVAAGWAKPLPGEAKPLPGRSPLETVAGRSPARNRCGRTGETVAGPVQLETVAGPRSKPLPGGGRNRGGPIPRWAGDRTRGEFTGDGRCGCESVATRARGRGGKAAAVDYARATLAKPLPARSRYTRNP